DINLGIGRPAREGRSKKVAGVACDEIGERAYNILVGEMNEEIAAQHNVCPRQPVLDDVQRYEMSAWPRMPFPVAADEVVQRGGADIGFNAEPDHAHPVKVAARRVE